MRSLLSCVSAVGALALLTLSPHSAGATANAAPAGNAVASKPDASVAAPRKDDGADVPAPPMALLFGIGAVGLIWGRRLAASARRAREGSPGKSR